MTPACKLLKANKIEYSIHEYEHDANAKSFGLEAAEKLGLLITFFYEEEKNISEIAVITGQTEGNVKVKLYRLRKKLAAWMQEED